MREIPVELGFSQRTSATSDVEAMDQGLLLDGPTHTMHYEKGYTVGFLRDRPVYTL